MGHSFSPKEKILDLGLSGRRVLITGASQGIGRGLAKAFADVGARVAVVARREPQLKSLVDEMGGELSGHRSIAVDLMSTGEPDGAVDWLVGQGGPFDVVVHNLGGSLGVKSLDASSKEWERVWRFNVGIAIDINNRVLPGMADRGWGRIVHMSSRVAVEFGGAGPYAAAKSYLNAYTTILGRAFAARGVLVNAVMPSAVAANGNNWWKASRDNPTAVAAFLSQHQAINRLGTPDDITPFVLLLASDRNSFAAGSIVSVDGGSR